MPTSSQSVPTARLKVCWPRSTFTAKNTLLAASGQKKVTGALTLSVCGHYILNNILTMTNCVSKMYIPCLTVSLVVYNWTPNMYLLLVRCVLGWRDTTWGSSESAGAGYALWLHLCPNTASASHLRETAYGGDGPTYCRERRGDPTCCRVQKFTGKWKATIFQLCIASLVFVIPLSESMPPSA